eukprot:COSAG06_NODE_18451_length_887_cov_0.837563_2_plen_36_part_01
MYSIRPANVKVQARYVPYCTSGTVASLLRTLLLALL